MHVMAKPHRMITAIRLETQLSLICGAPQDKGGCGVIRAYARRAVGG